MINKIALIEIVKATSKQGLLDVDYTFMEATSKYIASLINGCGAANARFDFVPDTIYGMSIVCQCSIHDWDYFIGKTIEHKRKADRRLLNNLLRAIERVSDWRRFIKPLMRRRALKIYEAVNTFGGPAFWDGKN